MKSEPGSTGQSSQGRYTVYDGAINVGGSRSWRNHNPGNIEYGNFTKDHGAIGGDPRFAIFPDTPTGTTALHDLLKSRKYQQLTIAAAIALYAPVNENPTAAYQSYVQEHVGVDADTPMSSLTPKQIASVALAIQHFEGWKPGTTYKKTDPDLPDWVQEIFGV